VSSTIHGVQEAIDAYLQAEQMPADTVFRCDGRKGCGDTSAPLKQHCITHPPTILLLQLKRWGAHQHDGALLHAVTPEQEITVNTCRSGLAASSATKGSHQIVAITVVSCGLGRAEASGGTTTTARDELHDLLSYKPPIASEPTWSCTRRSRMTLYCAGRGPLE